MDVKPYSYDQLEPSELDAMARRHLAEGDLATARNLFEKTVQRAPRHHGAFAMLGSICYQVGEDMQAEVYVDSAIEILRRLAKQRPDKHGVRASLANLVMARGNEEEAIQLIRDIALPIRPIRASEEEFRQRISAARAEGLPSILINTVPKSASESIWNRLATGLGLAQGHVSIFLYPDCAVVPHRALAAAPGGLIAKEHLPASDYNVQQLALSGYDRIVFHLRDPRQVLLSWAHFVRDDVSMRLLGALWRKVVPPTTVLQQDLSGLIDWCIDTQLPLLIAFVEGWRRLGSTPHAPLAVRFLSFESYLDAPEGYLKSVLDFAEIDPARFDFEAESQTVHLRKGEKAEWRAVFTGKQRERAARLIPPEMAEEFGWNLK